MQATGTTIHSASVVAVGNAAGGCIAVLQGGSFNMTGGSIESCQAFSADSWGVGGGVYADGQGSSITLTDSFIRRTRASSRYSQAAGGAMMLEGDAVASLRNIDISDAHCISAEDVARGGGIYLSFADTLTIIDSRIADTTVNATMGEATGGGLMVWHGTANMIRTNFSNTRVVSEAGNNVYGGGLGIIAGAVNAIERVVLEWQMARRARAAVRGDDRQGMGVVPGRE